MTDRGPRYRESTRALVFALPVVVAGLAVYAWRHPLERASIEPEPTGLRINVNTADLDTLTLLPGVGPGVAERIIDRRERVGRFRSLSDLEQVPLIGPVTISKLQPWVTLEDGAAEGGAGGGSP